MDDLKEEREAVVDAINKIYFWEAVYAESFIARSESPKEICLEEVRNSDIYIGLFKTYCGYIPEKNNPFKKFVVEMEYDEAIANNISTLIFIHKDDSNREQKLNDFIEKISNFDSGHWRKEYSTTDELAKLVLEAINSELIRVYVQTRQLKKKREIKEIYALPFFDKLKEN